jgi:hypothetical protein
LADIFTLEAKGWRKGNKSEETNAFLAVVLIGSTPSASPSAFKAKPYLQQKEKKD